MKSPYVQGIRLLREDRRLLWLIFLETGLQVLADAVPILLAAKIAQYLLSGQTGALPVLAGLLALYLILRLGNQVLRSCRVVSAQCSNMEKKQRMISQLLAVDYHSFIDQQLGGRFREAQNILHYSYNYGDLAQDLAGQVQLAFHLLLGLVFLWPLLTALGTEEQVFAAFLCLGLPLLVRAFLQAQLNRRYGAQLRRHIEEHSQVERRLAYVVQELVYNVLNYPVYSVFQLHDFLRQKMGKEQRQTVDFFMAVRGIQIRKDSLLMPLVLIQHALTYAFLFWQARQGLVPLAWLLPFVQALNLFQTALLGLQNGRSALVRNIGFLNQVESVLGLEEEDKEEGLDIPAGEPSWDFCSVSLRYPDQEEKALDNLNFRLGGKKSVALLGENGAGKTSLILLLAGLLRPTEGQILYKGLPLDQLRKADYRRELACLFQEEGGLAIDGPSFLALGAADPEVARTYLQRLGFRDIQRFWEAQDVEALGLSGGEMQKVLISRCLARPAQAYILDEPNSALDPLSAQRLYEQSLELAGEKFLLYISHQLGFAKGCQELLFLEKGRLLGQGSHEELLRSIPSYRDLWAQQQALYRGSLRESES